MNRRTFLGLAAAASAALALDPERLLWVPGAKTIFLPPERSVVLAEIGDVEAVKAALGGPFVTGVTWVTGGRGGRVPVSVAGRLTSPQAVVEALTDEEFRLVVDRGRKLLAARTPRPRVSTSAGWPTVWRPSRLTRRED